MTDAFDPYHKWLGIPAEQQPPDHYQLLGLKAFENDPDVIANAVDRRRSHIRTLQSGPQGTLATKLLSEIAAAKVCLLQPSAKQQYDQVLAQRKAALGPPPPLPMAAPSVTAAPPAAAVIPVGTALPTGNSLEYAMQPASPAVVAEPYSSSSSTRTRSRTKSKAASSAQWMYLGGMVLLAVCLGAVAIGILISRSGTSTETEIAKHVTDIDSTAQHRPGSGGNGSNSKSGQSGSSGAADTKPAVLASGGMIDLLTLVDSKRDALAGTWTKTAGTLTSPSDSESRLQIPFPLPTDYDLTAFVTRQSGSGALSFTLIGDGKPFRVVLDDVEGQRSELSGVTSDVGSNLIRHSGSVLTLNKSTMLAFQVRKDALVLTADGQVILQWHGSFSQLASLPSQWIAGDKPYLLLGAGSSFSITQLQLWGASRNPVLTNLTPAPLQNNGPKTPLPVKPLPATTPDTTPMMVKKLAVPNAATQRQAQELIKDVYKDDLAKAKKPEEKFALAEKLFKKGADATEDPVVRFTALQMASDLAGQVGDWRAVMMAVDEQYKAFDLSAVESKATDLERANEPATPGYATTAADELFRMVDDATGEDDFGLAQRIIKLLHIASRKAKDAELTKRISAKDKDVKALEQQYTVVKGDLDLLKQDPNNADANLAAGRWFGFGKGAWDKALPMLARGSSAALKDLAQKEAAAPSEADAQMQLGDAWWDVAEAEADPLAKLQIQQHAANWYQQAVNQLSGLSKTKVEKRLADVDKAMEGRSGYISATRLTPTNKRAFKDLISVNQLPASKDAKDVKPPIGVQGERVCTEYIFAHAPSKLTFDIPEGVKEFRTVGYCVANKAVKFQINVDNKRIFESAQSGIVSIKITLAKGCKKIDLIVDDMGSNSKKHSFWCYPRFYR